MQPLQRIGAIGDIHAEDRALSATLRFLERERVDAILAVGDIVDGHGDCDRCCALLRDRAVWAVRGNHDRWFLEGTMRRLDAVTEQLAEPHRRWLASLPVTRRFATPLGSLLLCHGVGDDDMAVLKSHTDDYTLRWLEVLRELQRDPDIVFMLAGHTHERMVRQLEGLTVINAGTLHREHGPGFVIVDFASRRVSGFDVVGQRVRAAETYAL